jgi:metallo-beta-lactamase class B
MLKIASIFIFLSVPVLIFAQRKNQIAPNLTLDTLTENVLIHTSYQPWEGIPFPSNGLLIVTGDRVILVDTPWGLTPTIDLLAYIKETMKKTVTHCIVTHFHADRVGGVDALKKSGATVMGNKRTIELLKDSTHLVPDVPLKDDELMSIHGVDVHVYYPGKGHTRDNIVVYLPKEKVLFGGCFVKSMEAKGMGNVSDADLQAWPQSIRRVKVKFSPEFIVPGHQRHCVREECLDYTLDLLKAHR